MVSNCLQTHCQILGNISGCQYYVKRAGGEILKRNPRTFRAAWKEEREMEELVGTVDSAGPRLVTLKTQVGHDCEDIDKVIVVVASDNLSR